MLNAETKFRTEKIGLQLGAADHKLGVDQAAEEFLFFQCFVFMISSRANAGGNSERSARDAKQ